MQGSKQGNAMNIIHTRKKSKFTNTVTINQAGMKKNSDQREVKTGELS